MIDCDDLKTVKVVWDTNFLYMEINEYWERGITQETRIFQTQTKYDTQTIHIDHDMV